MHEGSPFAGTIPVENGPALQCVMDYLDETGIEHRVFACERERNNNTCGTIASNVGGIISTQGVCQVLNNSNVMHYDA